MPYAKLDVIVDTETIIIYDHSLRLKPRHDALVTRQIAKRTKQREIKVLGDKSYDSKPLHEEFDKKCIKFYALVRKNERNTPKGHFRKKCRELDNNYNRRNTVESVYSMH